MNLMFRVFVAGALLAMAPIASLAAQGAPKSAQLALA
jgi:hypothetical protein